MILLIISGKIVNLENFSHFRTTYLQADDLLHVLEEIRAAKLQFSITKWSGYNDLLNNDEISFKFFTVRISFCIFFLRKNFFLDTLQQGRNSFLKNFTQNSV
jgi:hypothetical protein